MNAATIARLKHADERTKNMTKDEYVHYSECRQASFTFRKAKRFRDWAGFGIVTDSKPNDDIVDILGFLTFEIVQTLTEEALKVKAEEDLTKSRNGETDAQSKKRKRETGLFDPPEEGRAPVGPKHIQEAFRRLQQRPIPGRGARVWMGGPRALHRSELKLVCQGYLINITLPGSFANVFLDMNYYICSPRLKFFKVGKPNKVAGHWRFSKGDLF